ncbi:MAG: spermidine/putrescine ABC transporter substrate-binding protein [Gammaproteobacteria bacterium]|jgi:spermidine/putrescine transport system substrate-binding protein|nr:spermidine/putrescine ABC transporter substrate-binding protein [Gammaproteobacteria bacterium]
MRAVHTLLAVWLGLAVAIASPADSRPELVFFTWADYVDPEVIADFERESGARVRQVFFESDDDRNDKLLATEGQGYDVVTVDQGSLGLLARRGWLEPLEEAPIPNRVHLDPTWIDAVPDGRRFGIPYFWGTLGIGYREDLVPDPPRSWAELFRPAQALHGQVLMIQDPRELVGMALKSLGFSANSAEPTALAAAEKLLRSQKPHVQSYSYVNLTEKSALVTGAAAVAMVYNGDALKLQELHPRIRYVIPAEGGSLWGDYLTVARSSASKPLAHRFLDFLHRPEVAARNAAFVHYATPNRAAAALMPPEYREDPVIHPRPEVLARCEHLGAFPPRAAKARNDIYARLTR